MVKLKVPFFSFRAKGKIGEISLTRRHRINVAEKTPVVPDAKSPGQLAWRPMFLLARDLWHALSPLEKQAWERAATPRHLTGYMWFMSQALRPNPGIYLPLAGGTMQGAIDMAGFKIEDLPDPAAAQEPVTKQYFEDNLPSGGYTQGARVYHDVDQSIPHASTTTLAFNSESYDTDSIHDNVTNNSRLTCKTAGKYIIVAQARWAGNPGQSELMIELNGVTRILDYLVVAGDFRGMNGSTIYDMAVNDYVEFQVYQTSGDALDIYAFAYSPIFMMQRIG